MPLLTLHGSCQGTSPGVNTVHEQPSNAKGDEANTARSCQHCDAVLPPEPRVV
jgi:hypothetical protein